MQCLNKFGVLDRRWNRCASRLHYLQTALENLRFSRVVSLAKTHSGIVLSESRRKAVQNSGEFLNQKEFLIVHGFTFRGRPPNFPFLREAAALAFEVRLPSSDITFAISFLSMLQVYLSVGFLSSTKFAYLQSPKRPSP